MWKKLKRKVNIQNFKKIREVECGQIWRIDFYWIVYKIFISFLILKNSREVSRIQRKTFRFVIEGASVLTAKIQKSNKKQLCQIKKKSSFAIPDHETSVSCFLAKSWQS